MKLCFPVRQQNNLDAALLPFVQSRPLNLYCVSTGRCILHADRTVIARLNPMMETSIHGQRIRSKARAGVINLEQSNGPPGAVFYRSFNVSRVTSADRVQNRTNQVTAAASAENMSSCFVPVRVARSIRRSNRRHPLFKSVESLQQFR